MIKTKPYDYLLGRGSSIKTCLTISSNSQHRNPTTTHKTRRAGATISG